ncbi:hypothetical protein BH09PLA1_BH09PLA1_01600 [soil metagenome]
MTRFQITICRTAVALVVGAGIFTQTGCSSVAERRVDVGTGEVTTVNRHQFFVKSMFGGKGERVAYVQSQPMQTTAQPMAAPNQFVPQQRLIPQQQFAQQPQPYVQQQQQFSPQQGAPQMGAWGAR